MNRLTGVLLLLLVLPVVADDELDAAFPQSDIVIAASENACYRFGVHVAINAAQWRRGLMHVRYMDRWRGMLFVYNEDAERSMWMKNTFIALDMLFIRQDGSIARIARSTEPQSLASISSGEPVRYVLELNAGVTASLGITSGDIMTWSGDLATP